MVASEERGTESYYLMNIDFHFCKMVGVLDMDGHTVAQQYGCT